MQPSKRMLSDLYYSVDNHGAWGESTLQMSLRHFRRLSVSYCAYRYPTPSLEQRLNLPNAATL